MTTQRFLLLTGMLAITNISIAFAMHRPTTTLQKTTLASMRKAAVTQLALHTYPPRHAIHYSQQNHIDHARGLKSPLPQPSEREQLLREVWDALHETHGFPEATSIALRVGMSPNALVTKDDIPLLLAAVKNKQYDAACLLIGRGAQTNIRDIHGNTPLHFAAANNKPGCVKLLLTHCANVHAKNENGATALHSAMAQGNNVCVQMLLDGKADINAMAKGNISALHLAIGRDHKDTTMILIDHKADVNAKTTRGKTPLTVALYTENKEIEKMLIAAGATN